MSPQERQVESRLVPRGVTTGGDLVKEEGKVRVVGLPLGEVCSGYENGTRLVIGEVAMLGGVVIAVAVGVSSVFPTLPLSIVVETDVVATPVIGTFI